MSSKPLLSAKGIQHLVMWRSRVAEGTCTPLRPLRTGRETLASSGSYTPASGRTPCCHRTNRLGSRQGMRPSCRLAPRPLPQEKRVGITAAAAPQPVHRRTLPASEPRVFPLRPFPESLIEVTEHLNAPRAIDPPVVVHPAPHHRVRKASQILQALVVPGGRHPPAADGLPDRRRGLGADRRQEADEVSPPPVLRPSRLEGVAEEVERDVFILTRPVSHRPT